MYIFFFSTINANHFLCDCLPERVHNWMNKIFYSILFFSVAVKVPAYRPSDPGSIPARVTFHIFLFVFTAR